MLIGKIEAMKTKVQSVYGYLDWSFVGEGRPCSSPYNHVSDFRQQSLGLPACIEKAENGATGENRKLGPLDSAWNPLRQSCELRGYRSVALAPSQ